MLRLEHEKYLEIDLSGAKNRRAAAPVELDKQLATLWCWASCASMVLMAAGRDVAQCKVASKRIEKACNDDDEVSEGANQPLPVKRVETVWDDWKVKSKPLGKVLSPADLETEMEASRPVEIFLSKDCEDGHLVLIVDLFEDEDDENGRLAVLIADPDNGVAFVPASLDAIGKELRRGPWCNTWKDLPASQL